MKTSPDTSCQSGSTCKANNINDWCKLTQLRCSSCKIEPGSSFPLTITKDNIKNKNSTYFKDNIIIDNIRWAPPPAEEDGCILSDDVQGAMEIRPYPGCYDCQTENPIDCPHRQIILNTTKPGPAKKVTMFDEFSPLSGDTWTGNPQAPNWADFPASSTPIFQCDINRNTNGDFKSTICLKDCEAWYNNKTGEPINNNCWGADSGWPSPAKSINQMQLHIYNNLETQNQCCWNTLPGGYDFGDFWKAIGLNSNATLYKTINLCSPYSNGLPLITIALDLLYNHQYNCPQGTGGYVTNKHNSCYLWKAGNLYPKSMQTGTNSWNKDTYNWKTTGDDTSLCKSPTDCISVVKTWPPTGDMPVCLQSNTCSKGNPSMFLGMYAPLSKTELSKIVNCDDITKINTCIPNISRLFNKMIHNTPPVSPILGAVAAQSSFSTPKCTLINAVSFTMTSTLGICPILDRMEPLGFTDGPSKDLLTWQSRPTISTTAPPEIISRPFLLLLYYDDYNMKGTQRSKGFRFLKSDWILDTHNPDDQKRFFSDLDVTNPSKLTTGVFEGKFEPEYPLPLTTDKVWSTTWGRESVPFDPSRPSDVSIGSTNTSLSSFIFYFEYVTGGPGHKQNIKPSGGEVKIMDLVRYGDNVKIFQYLIAKPNPQPHGLREVYGGSGQFEPLQDVPIFPRANGQKLEKNYLYMNPTGNQWSFTSEASKAETFTLEGEVKNIGSCYHRKCGAPSASAATPTATLEPVSYCGDGPLDASSKFYIPDWGGEPTKGQPKSFCKNTFPIGGQQILGPLQLPNPSQYQSTNKAACTFSMQNSSHFPIKWTCPSIAPWIDPIMQGFTTESPGA